MSRASENVWLADPQDSISGWVMSHDKVVIQTLELEGSIRLLPMGHAKKNLSFIYLFKTEGVPALWVRIIPTGLGEA